MMDSYQDVSLTSSLARVRSAYGPMFEKIPYVKKRSVSGKTIKEYNLTDREV